jgi:hypothetical protein
MCIVKEPMEMQFNGYNEEVGLFHVKLAVSEQQIMLKVVVQMTLWFPSLKKLSKLSCIVKLTLYFC